VPIVDLVDERGYTCLHEACFKNTEELTNVIIEKAKQTTTDSELKEWVNAKTNEDGFTSLHFASFRGNVPMI
jgi:ankyrin repeat protein